MRQYMTDAAYFWLGTAAGVILTAFLFLTMTPAQAANPVLEELEARVTLVETYVDNLQTRLLAVENSHKQLRCQFDYHQANYPEFAGPLDCP